MPDRILRDYTTSAKFDLVTAEAERLFNRLLTKADDFGRFHRDPKLVRSLCFPRSDALRANTVDAWLTELSDRQLVFSYQVRNDSYLAIVNFRQRLKRDTAGNITSRPKFPAPEGKTPVWLPDDGNWREHPGSDGPSLPYSESESLAYSQSGLKKTLPTKLKRESTGGGKKTAPESAIDHRRSPIPRQLTTAELEIAKLGEALLGENQWPNDNGKWIARITGRGEKQNGQAEPARVERVFAELKSAMVEGRIRTTPAQYAEQIWKEYSGK